MKLKVSQRPEVFFDLFEESGANLRAATGELRAMVHDYTDIELKARRIQEREHEGDEVTHAIIRQAEHHVRHPDGPRGHLSARDRAGRRDGLRRGRRGPLRAAQHRGAAARDEARQVDVLHRAAEQTAQALRAFRNLNARRARALLGRDQQPGERGRPALPPRGRGPVLRRLSSDGRPAVERGHRDARGGARRTRERGERDRVRGPQARLSGRPRLVHRRTAPPAFALLRGRWRDLAEANAPPGRARRPRRSASPAANRLTQRYCGGVGSKHQQAEERQRGEEQRPSPDPHVTALIGRYTR